VAERLVDDLWGEDAPATAPNLVQGGVSSLRKALACASVNCGFPRVGAFGEPDRPHPGSRVNSIIRQAGRKPSRA
jgi:hypothetical protein